MNESSNPHSKSERLRFEGRDEAQAIAPVMAQQAKQQISILGRDINQALFANQEFIDCISDLAGRSPTTQIRIFVHDTRLNQQNGHRLIPLAQHLTSSIHIHNTTKQHRDLATTQLLVDDFAYLTYPRATQYIGYTNLHDRLEVRQLQQKFDQLWQQSSPDITVRRLDL